MTAQSRKRLRALCTPEEVKELVPVLRHKHKIDWLTTSWRVDGYRLHKCVVDGCLRVEVLPPLAFNDDGNRVSKGGYK